MRIIGLKPNAGIYTCNVYLVLGDWNHLKDLNTLVDTGADGYVIDEIERISTGVGKKKLEQVVLTHNHFDHAGGLAAIKERFGARVFAHSHIEGVDELLADGRRIRLGDCEFEVIYTFGHSDDSICLYCAEERALFSGDTELNIRTPGGSYPSSFVKALERLSGLRIETVYSGHGQVMKNADEMICDTLINVRKSRITE